MSEDSPQGKLLFVTSPLSPITHPYHAGLSDHTVHTSDVCSQSEGLSETPGGSITSSHYERRSIDNPRKKKPTSLSYYRSTEAHAPLTEAKESFAATAFSSGCFFFHQQSCYISEFKTYARDAIAQAANSHNSKCFNFYYYHCSNYYFQRKYISTKTS